MVSLATNMIPTDLAVKTGSEIKLERTSQKRPANQAGAASPGEGATKRGRLDLFKFVPFSLNRVAAEVSQALSSEYQTRYGLDIPEWRVLGGLSVRTGS